MITRIDHVTICVPDLDAGVAQFKKLGFNMAAGGAHPGKGAHNAIEVPVAGNHPNGVYAVRRARDEPALAPLTVAPG
jgi:hypothetical protein